MMFLLVELQLCNHQPEKAVNMLGYIEKNLLGNGKSSSPDKDEAKGKEGSHGDNASTDALRQRICLVGGTKGYLTGLLHFVSYISELVYFSTRLDVI